MTQLIKFVYGYWIFLFCTPNAPLRNEQIQTSSEPSVKKLLKREAVCNFSERAQNLSANEVGATFFCNLFFLERKVKVEF
jgi:hypothetical protein